MLKFKKVNKCVIAVLFVSLLCNACVKNNNSNPGIPAPKGLVVYLNDTLFIEDTTPVAHYGNNFMTLEDSINSKKSVHFALLYIYNVVTGNQPLKYMDVKEPTGYGDAQNNEGGNIIVNDPLNRFTINSINYAKQTMSGDFNVRVLNGMQSQMATGTFTDIRYNFPPTSSPSNQQSAQVNGNPVGKLVSAYWDPGHTKIVAILNDGSSILFYLDPNTPVGSYKISTTGYQAFYINASGLGYTGVSGSLKVNSNNNSFINASYNFTGYNNIYSPTDSVKVTSGNFTMGK